MWLVALSLAVSKSTSSFLRLLTWAATARAGRPPPRGEGPGDPVGEHPGLAGPRPGHDEQRAVLVQNGRALLRVEALQQGRRVHGEPGAGALGGWLVPRRGVVEKAAHGG